MSLALAVCRGQCGTLFDPVLLGLLRCGDRKCIVKAEHMINKDSAETAVVEEDRSHIISAPNGISTISKQHLKRSCAFGVLLWSTLLREP